MHPDAPVVIDQIRVSFVGAGPADANRALYKLRSEVPGNVWSAAGLQGKSEGSIDRSAQMYSAFEWRAESPGHDELRRVLFLINGTVMRDHFREQVASTPLGTVRSS
jgi:hypothetical protein